MARLVPCWGFAVPVALVALIVACGARSPLVCVRTPEVEIVPTLYLVLGASESMARGNRWADARREIADAIARLPSPRLRIGVAILGGSDESCGSTGEILAPDENGRLDAAAAAKAFLGVTATVSPKGGTPMSATLRTITSRLRSERMRHPMHLVLVTDGEPNHCQSSVDSVATEAAAAAADVKTYVIGVGDALSNLNKIAAAGGTGQAILVSTSSSTTISDSFKAALGTIASQALSCDYKIPAPPNGQSIDPNKVNVRYSATGGAGTTLTYSANCATDGWHYDSASGPSKIILCPSTCDRVMKDKGAKIDVFFGCAVKGGIPH